jgi:hypothetical protein
MDRCLEGDHRQDVGWLHAKGAARGAPCLNSGDELTKELHRSN